MYEYTLYKMSTTYNVIPLVKLNEARKVEDVLSSTSEIILKITAIPETSPDMLDFLARNYKDWPTLLGSVAINPSTEDKTLKFILGAAKPRGVEEIELLFKLKTIRDVVSERLNAKKEGHPIRSIRR
jgi:hypothetical protein